MGIPKSQNHIPEVDAPPTPLAAQAVRRALATREATYAEEVQRLLDAGMRVMQSAGPEGAPKVAEIVREAGLSNQAFYRHFASRDELVAAVVESGALRLVGYAAHQMAKHDDPVAQIRTWIEAVLSQAIRPELADPTRAVLWNLRQLPRQVGADGPATGPMATATLLLEPLRALGSDDPEHDAMAIADVVFGRLDHHLWGPTATAADVEHVVAFCLAAVSGGRTRTRR